MIFNNADQIATRTQGGHSYMILYTCATKKNMWKGYIFTIRRITRLEVQNGS